MIVGGGYNRTPVEERILSACSRDETTGCLLFARRLDKDGYGQVSQEGKTKRAHKVMWELKNGAVPAGMVLIHLCDDKYPADSKAYRACCEVSHLKVGTVKENAERMSSLGRSAGGSKPGDNQGESNANSKLSLEQVLEIRERRLTHDKRQKPFAQLYAEMAVDYKVSKVTIQKIIGNKLWYDPDYTPP